MGSRGTGDGIVPDASKGFMRAKGGSNSQSEEAIGCCWSVSQLWRVGRLVPPGKWHLGTLG
jgi:hypothetical protein